MKKLASLCFIVSIVLVTAIGAYGAYTGPSSARVSTVSEAKEMPDDADVILEGRIDMRLGHEKYQFSDETGTITVEIEDDEWRGVDVGPGDVVVIYGEVERKSHGTEIEAERVEKKISK
jgi:uncharacterized protein (TIGR00156 family)